MKKILIIILLLQISSHIQAQYQMDQEYTGEEYFLNPIFAGDYPDPSIIRDGDTYYIVHSSFEYYPGLLIWESKDLINWKPITNALHKYVGSVWAPDLVKHNGKYYIYFPADNEIYVVFSDSINGKWSDPIRLNIQNIDPGHCVDSDGNRYLYFSNGGYVPLSDDGLTVIGEMKHVYDGWEIPREWTIECFCMEGPKISKHGEYYYLTTAQGGTAGPATSHMILSARSKSPLGPWENSPYNPIIRTKSNNEKWWSKGHGTLIDDADENWWIVFHGYENGFYNMGRQTLLEPVEWTEDAWFKTPDGITTDKKIKRPPGKKINYKFSLSDNFSGSELKSHWKFWGEYDTTRFTMSGSGIEISGKGNSVSNSSPLLCVPSNHSYTAQVELNINGNAIGGLVLFYNSNFYSGILADNNNILANLRGWQFPTERNVIDGRVYLRLKNVNNTVDMFYSNDGNEWIKIENSAEVSGFHHNVLSGFLSLRIGLCSIGEGSVEFSNFEYKPIIND